MGFITHICQLLLGALVGWSVIPKNYWNFEKLKIANLASGSVLAQGVNMVSLHYYMPKPPLKIDKKIMTLSTIILAVSLTIPSHGCLHFILY